MKQSISIRNEALGTEKVLLLERETGRLSMRQARECFKALVPLGYHPAGILGEWPVVQAPPESPEQEFQAVRVGEPEGGMSNIYFVPVSSVEPLLERFGVSVEAEAGAA